MHDEATTATPAPAPDFTDQVNNAFRAFVAEQAEVLIGQHGCVRGAALVAIDGNGYVSIASFALSKTGTDILLADALALSRSREPDVQTGGSPEAPAPEGG